MSHHPLRRAAAVLATTTLTAGAFAAFGTAPAQAAGDPKPVSDAATWLSGQLDADGLFTYESGFGPYTDIGLSIDGGLGFIAAGKTAARDKVVTAVSSRINTYANPGGYAKAGQLAKAAVLAKAAGQNPAAFGGLDLVTELAGTVATAAPIQGRIVDEFDPNDQYGADYANVVSQTFAVRALQGNAAQASTIDFLVKQQCSAGFFRTYFTGNAAAPDQTCDGETVATNKTPSVDTTAFAVEALPAGNPARAKAATWLASVQNTDGSFAETGDGLGNGNSTGLAASALASAGRTAAAAKAATWLRTQQATNAGACTTYKAADRGAVALNAASLADGALDGITVDTRGTWIRATTQAIGGLQSAPAAAGAKVTPRAGFVRAGSKQLVQVTGAAPGDNICVILGTQKHKAVIGANGRASVTVTLAARTADNRIRVVGTGGVIGARTTTGLAKLKVPFTVRSTVRQGKQQTVRVRGLKKNERVTITLRGKKVRTVRANANGRAVVKFTVAKKYGKVGTARLKVTGHFTNRVNSKTFRIAR